MADPVDTIPGLREALTAASKALEPVLEAGRAFPPAKGSSRAIAPAHTDETVAFANLASAKDAIERLLYPRAARNLPKEAPAPIRGTITESELRKLAAKRPTLRDEFEGAHGAIVELRGVMKPYTRQVPRGPNMIDEPPNPDLRIPNMVISDAHDVLADALAILRA